MAGTDVSTYKRDRDNGVHSNSGINSQQEELIKKQQKVRCGIIVWFYYIAC